MNYSEQLLRKSKYKLFNPTKKTLRLKLFKMLFYNSIVKCSQRYLLCTTKYDQNAFTGEAIALCDKKIIIIC